MTYISETRLKELQIELLNTFAQLRLDIIDILMTSKNASYQLVAEKLPKISSDELLDIVSEFHLPAIANKTASMKRIDAALNNIQIELYGLCADCEKEIGIEQLSIDPTQQRCHECETKYQKQKRNSYKL